MMTKVMETPTFVTNRNMERGNVEVWKNFVLWAVTYT